MISKAGNNSIVEMVVKPVNGKIQIMITNSSKRPKNIGRGDIIATCSPVTIVEEIKNFEEFYKFVAYGNNDISISISEHIDSIRSSKIESIWHPGDMLKFTNSNLTIDQQRNLKDLVNEFHVIFSRNDSDIGKIDRKYGHHDIKVTNDTPITQKPYKTPYSKESVIKESIGKMLDMNEVETSDSYWSSPIVLVKKSDGTERFCVDYRKLNEVTIKDRYRMPSIESKLNKLHGCKFFSTLVCTSGYWQNQYPKKQNN